MMKKETNKLIGLRLRKLRLQKDISEKVIASIINTSQSTYSRIDHGEISLNIEKAKLLANYFKVDVAEITTLNNDKNKSVNIEGQTNLQDFTMLPNLMHQTIISFNAMMEMALENQKTIIELLKK